MTKIYDYNIENNKLFNEILYSSSCDSLDKIYFINNNTIKNFYTKLLYKNPLRNITNTNIKYIPIKRYIIGINSGSCTLFIIMRKNN